jgi:hypothetical protein
MNKGDICDKGSFRFSKFPSFREINVAIRPAVNKFSSWVSLSGNPTVMRDPITVSLGQASELNFSRFHADPDGNNSLSDTSLARQSRGLLWK